MSSTEYCAAPALRRIVAPAYDVARLICRFDHRHHNAERAGIECAGNEVILIGWHSHDRHDVDAAAVGDLLLHHVDARARMLHVQENKLGARFLRRLCQAGREEFEGKQTVSLFTALQFGFERVGAHHLNLVEATASLVR
jgi:hypothetical protein